MLDFTSDFSRLKSRAKSRFLAKTEFPSDFSRLKSRASSRALENCCGGRLFRVHATLPVGSVQLRVQHLRVKNMDKMLVFGKIQLRVQHFGAEKLDNELNIKWERTFLMTCSKTGDVFLRQRLFCLFVWTALQVFNRIKKKQNKDGKVCYREEFVWRGVAYEIFI